MSRVARLGGNGYRSHRQLVGPLGKSWWYLVLDAAGETVAMCDCEESADMVALALNETRRTHVVLAGIGGIDETVKPERNLVHEREAFSHASPAAMAMVGPTGKPYHARHPRGGECRCRASTECPGFEKLSPSAALDLVGDLVAPSDGSPPLITPAQGLALLSTVPDPAPTAPYLAEDEPPKEAG